MRIHESCSAASTPYYLLQIEGSCCPDADDAKRLMQLPNGTLCRHDECVSAVEHASED